MTLHTISRIRVIRRLYNAVCGGMNSFFTIDEWQCGKIVLDEIRYSSFTNSQEYGVIVCSPIKNREWIFQGKTIMKGILRESRK